MGVSNAHRRIAGEIFQERARQDAQLGGTPGIDRFDDSCYLGVLGEEYGEVCKDWLERQPAKMRAELIQVAAVAVAWIEELDNGGMRTRP